MKEAVNWIRAVGRILRWIQMNKVAYAEIRLTVKGGRVTFVDYCGMLKGVEDGDDSA